MGPFPDKLETPKDLDISDAFTEESLGVLHAVFLLRLWLGPANTEGVDWVVLLLPPNNDRGDVGALVLAIGIGASDRALIGGAIIGTRSFLALTFPGRDVSLGSGTDLTDDAFCRGGSVAVIFFDRAKDSESAFWRVL